MIAHDQMLQLHWVSLVWLLGAMGLSKWAEHASKNKIANVH